MTHHAPESLDGTSRCLGWMCNLRDICARHMEEREVTIRQWFLPHHPGENCEWFVAYDEGEE